MDIVIKIILLLHFIGLGMGVGSGMAMMRVMPQIGQSGAAERARLFSAARGIGLNGNVGLGLLWVTGILLVILGPGLAVFSNPWFVAKLVFVVILSAAMGMGGAAVRKFAAGDNAASVRAAMMGRVGGASSLLTILCAVFAFS